jgi:hypothetical protein
VPLSPRLGQVACLTYFPSSSINHLAIKSHHCFLLYSSSRALYHRQLINTLHSIQPSLRIASAKASNNMSLVHFKPVPITVQFPYPPKLGENPSTEFTEWSDGFPNSNPHRSWVAPTSKSWESKGVYAMQATWGNVGSREGLACSEQQLDWVKTQLKEYAKDAEKRGKLLGHSQGEERRKAVMHDLEFQMIIAKFAMNMHIPLNSLVLQYSFWMAFQTADNARREKRLKRSKKKHSRKKSKKVDEASAISDGGSPIQQALQYSYGNSPHPLGFNSVPEPIARYENPDWLHQQALPPFNSQRPPTLEQKGETQVQGPYLSTQQHQAMMQSPRPQTYPNFPSQAPTTFQAPAQMRTLLQNCKIHLQSGAFGSDDPNPLITELGYYATAEPSGLLSDMRVYNPLQDGIDGLGSMLKDFESHLAYLDPPLTLDQVEVRFLPQNRTQTFTATGKLAGPWLGMFRSVARQNLSIIELNWFKQSPTSPLRSLQYIDAFQAAPRSLEKQVQERPADFQPTEAVNGSPEPLGPVDSPTPMPRKRARSPDLGEAVSTPVKLSIERPAPGSNAQSPSSQRADPSTPTSQQKRARVEPVEEGFVPTTPTSQKSRTRAHLAGKRFSAKKPDNIQTSSTTHTTDNRIWAPTEVFDTLRNKPDDDVEMDLNSDYYSPVQSDSDNLDDFNSPTQSDSDNSVFDEQQREAEDFSMEVARDQGSSRKVSELTDRTRPSSIAPNLKQGNATAAVEQTTNSSPASNSSGGLAGHEPESPGSISDPNAPSLDNYPFTYKAKEYEKFKFDPEDATESAWRFLQTVGFSKGFYNQELASEIKDSLKKYDIVLKLMNNVAAAAVDYVFWNNVVLPTVSTDIKAYADRQTLIAQTRQRLDARFADEEDLDDTDDEDDEDVRRAKQAKVDATYDRITAEFYAQYLQFFHVIEDPSDPDPMLRKANAFLDQPRNKLRRANIFYFFKPECQPHRYQVLALFFFLKSMIENHGILDADLPGLGKTYQGMLWAYWWPQILWQWHHYQLYKHDPTQHLQPDEVKRDPCARCPTSRANKIGQACPCEFKNYLPFLLAFLIARTMKLMQERKVLMGKEHKSSKAMCRSGIVLVIVPATICGQWVSEHYKYRNPEWISGESTFKMQFRVAHGGNEKKAHTGDRFSEIDARNLISLTHDEKMEIPRYMYIVLTTRESLESRVTQKLVAAMEARLKAEKWITVKPPKIKYHPPIMTVHHKLPHCICPIEMLIVDEAHKIKTPGTAYNDIPRTPMQQFLWGNQWPQQFITAAEHAGFPISDAKAMPLLTGHFLLLTGTPYEKGIAEMHLFLVTISLILKHIRTLMTLTPDEEQAISKTQAIFMAKEIWEKQYAVLKFMDKDRKLWTDADQESYTVFQEATAAILKRIKIRRTDLSKWIDGMPLVADMCEIVRHALDVRYNKQELEWNQTTETWLNSVRENNMRDFWKNLRTQPTATGNVGTVFRKYLGFQKSLILSTMFPKLGTLLPIHARLMERFYTASPDGKVPYFYKYPLALLPPSERTHMEMPIAQSKNKDKGDPKVTPPPPESDPKDIKLRKSLIPEIFGLDAELYENNSRLNALFEILKPIVTRFDEEGEEALREEYKDCLTDINSRLQKVLILAPGPSSALLCLIGLAKWIIKENIRDPKTKELVRVDIIFSSTTTSDKELIIEGFKDTVLRDNEGKEMRAGPDNLKVYFGNQKRHPPQILISTKDQLGTGMSFERATHLVVLSYISNFTLRLQAEYRIARINQPKKKVHVYTLGSWTDSELDRQLRETGENRAKFHEDLDKLCTNTELKRLKDYLEEYGITNAKARRMFQFDLDPLAKEKSDRKKGKKGKKGKGKQKDDSSDSYESSLDEV